MSLKHVRNQTQDTCNYAFYPKLKTVFLLRPVVLLESQFSLNILCSLDGGSNEFFHKSLLFQARAIEHRTLGQIAL